MYRLKVLGGLVLESDSEKLPASAQQRRRLTLLVVLAHAGDRGITRDRLLALLWPESKEESARHALDQLLYATRRDLGRDVVISEAGQLRINPERVRSDHAEFEARLARGETGRAVELYAGPFLDGVHLDNAPEFERWVEGERTRLAQRFASALERLAADARARGDHGDAARWWRRLAAADPLNGRIAVGLIRALADAGDRAGALQHARVHATLVREELGIEPDAEVLALEERLRSAPAAAPAAPPQKEREPHTPDSIPGAEAAVPTIAPAAALRPRSRRGVLIGGALLIALAGAAVLVHAGPFSASPSPAASARAVDPAAHALYLRGRIEWNRRSREGLERAIVLFRQATERDPTYPEAYAGLADAYVILGYLGYVPGDASFPKGKAAALQALALDSTMGEAHAALGVAFQWEKRWAEAEQSFIRAIAYAPEYATGHQWYALLLTILGRRQEAVARGRRAAELDPLSIQVHNTYGIMLYNAGALDSALHVYERVVTSEPDTAWVRQNPWVLSNFGRVAAAAGRYDDAIRLIEQAARAVPRHPRPLHALAVTYLTMGDPTRARSAFEPADPDHPHYPVYRALLHAQLGEVDAAFDWLDRVKEWSPVLLLPLGSDPALDALRADPRYPGLRRRIRLPAPPHE